MANVEFSDAGGGWLINGQKLVFDRNYRVAINSFLLTGKEEGMGFLNKSENETIKEVQTNDDTRRILINELQKQFGVP